MAPRSNVVAEFVATILMAFIAAGVVYLAARRYLAHHPQSLARIATPTKQRRALIRRIADIVCAICCLAYVGIVSWMSVFAHNEYFTGYDVGVFDQAVWNSLRGRLLEVSITTDTFSVLGHHFSPILLAFVPLYAIWSDPRTLLILQTVAVASAALPLYWLSRRWLGSLLSVVLVLAFLLSPPVENVNLWDFHEIAFAIPLLSFSIYFLMEGHTKAFLVCLGLCLLVKEEIAFMPIAFGIFVFLKSNRRLGAALFAFGCLWTAFLLLYAIPAFNETGKFIYANLLYPSMGSSADQVLGSFLARPDLVVSTVLTPDKIEFVSHLFLPLLLFPLLGAEISALAIPTFGYLLASNKDFYQLFYLQYSAPLLPFLFFGAVLGARRLMSLAKAGSPTTVEGRNGAHPLALKAALAALLLTATLANYLLWAPGPLSRRYNREVSSEVSAHNRLADSLLSQIPEDAAVVTEGNILPHVSERRQAWQVPWLPSDLGQVDYVFGDTTSFAHSYDQRTWDSLLASGYFRVTQNQGGYFFAERISPEHPTQIQFGNNLSLLGYSIVSTDTVKGGEDVRAFLDWSVNQPLPANYSLDLRLLDHRGNQWSEARSDLIEDVKSANLWRVGKTVTEQYVLSLPSTMPPDEYDIWLSVSDPVLGRTVAIRDQRGLAGSDQVLVGSVHVDKDKTDLTATDLEKRFELAFPYFVDMGEIRLIGFGPIPKTIGAGGTLPVGLYWHARVKPSADYTVSIQLIDAAGKVAFQQSDRPAAGIYPTTDWGEGEVLLDWHDLTIPRTLSAGEYRLHIALIDANTGAVAGQADLPSLSIQSP